MFLFLLLVLGVSCTLYALGCLSSSLSLIYLCAFAYQKNSTPNDAKMEERILILKNNNNSNMPFLPTLKGLYC